MISGRSTEPEDLSTSCAFATGTVAWSKPFNLSGIALLFVKQKKECHDPLLVKKEIFLE